MKLSTSDLRRLEAILEGPHSVTADIAVWDYRRQSPLTHPDGTPYKVEPSSLDWTIDGESLSTFTGSFELPLYELDTVTGKIITALTGKITDALLPFGNTLRIHIVVSNAQDSISVPLPWGVIWETEEVFKEGVLRVNFRGLETLVMQSELGKDAPTKDEWGTVGNTVKPWVVNLLERALPDWADNDNKLTIIDDQKLLGTKDYIADPDEKGAIPKETVWNAGTNLWEAASGLVASRSQARLAFDRQGRIVVYPALTEEYGVGGAVGGSDPEMVRLKIASTEPDADGQVYSGTLIDMTRRITREGFANRVRVIMTDTNVVEPAPSYPTGTLPGGTPGTGVGPAYWDGRVHSPVMYYYRTGHGWWPQGGMASGPIPVTTGEYYKNGGYHGGWDLSGLAYGQPLMIAPVGMGTPVYAVLSGLVRAVYNSAKDNPPGYNPGSGSPANYVVLWARDVCGQKVTVVYYHLKQGSVMVKAGSTITAGQPIARVGNSGNSTGPHLHIHASLGWRDLKQTWGKGNTSYPPGRHWGQDTFTTPPNPLNKGGMCKVGQMRAEPFLGFREAVSPDTSTSASVQVDTGPLRWGGPIGYAAKVFNMPEADPTTNEATTLAKARLAKMSALAEQVELRTLAFVHLDPGDAVGVEIPNPQDVTKATLRKYAVSSVSGSLPGGVLTINTKSYGRK